MSLLPTTQDSNLETGLALLLAGPDVTGPSARDPGTASELGRILDLIGNEAGFPLLLLEDQHTQQEPNCYPPHESSQAVYTPHYTPQLTYHTP